MNFRLIPLRTHAPRRPPRVTPPRLALVMLMLAGGCSSELRAPRVEAEQATFESRRRGEPLRRGAFAAGERIIVPEDGAIEVRVGDAIFNADGRTLFEFTQLAPLQVRVRMGELVVVTGAHSLELVVGDGSGERWVVGGETRASVDATSGGVVVERGAVERGAR